MGHNLNDRAVALAERAVEAADDLRAHVVPVSGGGRVLDLGLESEGGLNAGLELARIGLAGLGRVELAPGQLQGGAWPEVFVATDHPVSACLLSQYAGWQISVEKFFAMGSGPMRAAAAAEDLFETLDYRERPERCVGILETARLPGPEVLEYLADKTGLPREAILLLAAPTSSQAGTLQVVARSVETALHKLFELGFDVNRVVSAVGRAPLAPVAADDLTAIGRTNDAILYGGRITLWVHGDDDSLAETGPRVPSTASEAHGRPFLEIFEEAGRDFYAIDPHLFSPAELTVQNLDTGRVHRFGGTAPNVLAQSYGI